MTDNDNDQRAEDVAGETAAGLGRLSDPVSRVFARALNAATRLFHSINYYGSCAAALVYNRHRMGAKLDRVIASLQHNLDRDHDSYPYW